MADRDCPRCQEPMTYLGLGDELTSRDRVELVDAWECRPCDEVHVGRPQPVDGWRDYWRSAVARVLANRRTP